MHCPEKELIGLLHEAGTDFMASLPCEKIKVLLELVAGSFQHLPLTREEEGAGICAGAALAGKRPALFVQSSGVGNMLNALLSLNGFYELPLALFVSQRGVYKERIEAQLPMGQRLPRMLQAAGIPCSVIRSGEDFSIIRKKLAGTYRKNRLQAFLLSPAIWEGSNVRTEAGRGPLPPAGSIPVMPPARKSMVSPRYTRFELIQAVAPFLASRVVVCNLGIPSKELFAVRHQPSNFYMLGSMGMATPIGLGISLSTSKEVVVIDGDGSLLMNPGTLATAAFAAPANLTILAIDNGAYGSTGNQPTLTGDCVDLETVARGFGISNTLKTASKKELIAALQGRGQGPRFIHAIAVPGNSDVPNISLHHLENKAEVMQFIRA
ncbi:MAG: sulfopyruvate decarboxylase subunit alpha [Nitrospirae bacterium]|nr:MAG: sulfopyruvate decarboxylase subunit alpha [Nitrospirota bacterium]